ncbi:MAG: prepilin peptidase [Gemmataceae bacterium]|nr:prepilin peptidase [Gemmataceae bacterium]
MALALFFAFVFVVGACVGSFLNVVAARLPYEKSLLWPGSRCGACVQPIRWHDNLPVLGWLVLGGKCRTCGVPFSVRYPLVELLTGLAFVGLFWLVMVQNVLDLPAMRRPYANLGLGVVPEALPVFGHLAVLMSFLIAASLCDLEHMEIPLSVTIPGTLAGLALSALLPWPFPELADPGPLPGRLAPVPATGGTQPWPVWYPLPAWLPAGSWRLGLLTGVAGAAAGMLMMRAVRFLFTLGRGIEGLGVGDADLMMMVGAFVGWQPVVLGFFLAVVPALGFALSALAMKGEQALPFGPSLAIGSMGAVLAWPVVARPFDMLFFEPWFVFGGAGVMAGMLLALAFLLRLMRGGTEAA